MQVRRRLTVAGGVVACGLAAAGSALAAPSVSVRVEGLTRTLLPARNVTPPSSGSITKGGTPAGDCSADTAAGALDVATHHHWSGTYSSGLGIDVTGILGTTYSYTHGDYWSVWVDGRYAQSGICDLTLRAGEQLLFAPYPSKGTTYPIELSAPTTVTAGRSFTVKAFYYPGQNGRTKPVAGATFAGLSGTTNQHGVATLTDAKAGSLSLVASAKGYIRSAATSVTVAR